MDETNDFDRLIKNLTSQDTVTQQKKSGIIKTFINVVGSAALISCFGGLILLWANHIVINAYPNFTELSPGIGYFDASRLFFCGMIIYFVFSALHANKEK